MPTQFKSKKILIIDDDAYIRDVVNYILSEEGHEVTKLDNGHLVLETVRLLEPDIARCNVR